MNDLWTMIWKEWKDFLLSGGRSDLLRPLLILGIVGIVLPLSFRLSWINLDPAPVLIILYAPFMFVTSFIGDAIAGERERHTLETLLASRISDRAILLGKVIATVGYAWGIALVGLLLGLVLVNLLSGHGSWAFYHPFDVFLETLALSLLSSVLGASAGVLISLRSATVRQAQQILSIGRWCLSSEVFLPCEHCPRALSHRSRIPSFCFW